MADDDLTLLDRWCAGDNAAGNELFGRHFEALYRFFDHKTDGEPEDLVQETFLACTSARHKFQRKSSFRTYLFAIARYLLFGYWHRRKTGPQMVDIAELAELSAASLSTSVRTQFSRREDRGRLLTALRGLPLDQQILLEMFYWEEMNRDELAEVFEVETATIGSRLFRAREALHRALGATAAIDGEAAGDFDRWARDLARREFGPREPLSEDE